MREAKKRPEEKSSGPGLAVQARKPETRQGASGKAVR